MAIIDHKSIVAETNIKKVSATAYTFSVTVGYNFGTLFLLCFVK